MNSSPKTLMSSSPPGIRHLGLSSLRSLSRLLRRTPVGRLVAAATVQERLARWLIPPGSFRVGGVAPGDLVVDAGAHVGLYTLWASRAIGRSGRIVAFEPDPDNRRLLERDLASRTLVPRRRADLLADIRRRGVRNLLWRREEP